MAKRKKEINVKEPVRIREKVLGGGTISLYLDMYHKGNRKKEGLKLYIIPETSPTAKQQDKNTRRLAEQIKAQRILDIQKDGLVDWEKPKKSRTTLVSWLEDFVTCEAQLSPSGVISKRNAKVRVEEYLASIGKPDLRLAHGRQAAFLQDGLRRHRPALRGRAPRENPLGDRGNGGRSHHPLGGRRQDSGRELSVAVRRA
ncbi:MAG: hypothetical protein II751_05635 [Bacteroidales bacterium]|nr:hypothetical protein [Bacteroidales bacterium]